jgi:hypothetical protein
VWAIDMLHIMYSLWPEIISPIQGIDEEKWFIIIWYYLGMGEEE